MTDVAVIEGLTCYYDGEEPFDRPIAEMLRALEVEIPELRLHRVDLAAPPAEVVRDLRADVVVANHACWGYGLLAAAQGRAGRVLIADPLFDPPEREERALWRLAQRIDPGATPRAARAIVAQCFPRPERLALRVPVEVLGQGESARELAGRLGLSAIEPRNAADYDQIFRIVELVDAGTPRRDLCRVCHHGRRGEEGLAVRRMANLSAPPLPIGGCADLAFGFAVSALACPRCGRAYARVGWSHGGYVSGYDAHLYRLRDLPEAIAWLASGGWDFAHLVERMFEESVHDFC